MQLDMINELLIFLMLFGFVLWCSPVLPQGYTSGLVWVTKQGKKIKLSNMNVHHIAYTIDYCNKYKYRLEYLQDLKIELYLRWDSEKDEPLPKGQERYKGLIRTNQQ